MSLEKGFLSDFPRDFAIAEPTRRPASIRYFRYLTIRLKRRVVTYGRAAFILIFGRTTRPAVHAGLPGLALRQTIGPVRPGMLWHGFCRSCIDSLDAK